jgi:transposase
VNRDLALSSLLRSAAPDTTFNLRPLEEQGLRSYVSEPDRGRRKWKDDIIAQQAVYANRRRIRGERGKRLHRMRGELIERPFAHLYETGGMRRTHVRGHTNILKRLLIHAAGFNLGLVMRTSIGVGTPRGLQGAVQAFLGSLARLASSLGAVLDGLMADRLSNPLPLRACATHLQGSLRMAFATGC